MKKIIFLLLIPVFSFAQNDSVQTDKNEILINSKKPLYFVEGKLINESEVEKINPDEIESVNVLKGEKAIEKYGDEGKNGVIEIQLKEKEVSISETLENGMPICGLVQGVEINNNDSDFISDKQFPGTVCQASVRNYPKPNFVVNGELVSEDFVRNLNPNEIESIEIIKNADSIYSQHNLNGTIVITTKDSNYELPEYGLAVLDLGYESFLAMQPVAGTYSLNYLQNKNQRYVSVWNQRVISGNPEIYEMSIDYDSQTYYGLEFEYKLYVFFKFMEDKYQISFS